MTFKIAIVHDYLVADGGAEKCLRAFMEVFPDAPVYALFYDKRKFKDLQNRDIRTTFLDKIPFLKKRHYLFLPLYAAATESLNLKNYDLILTSSWAWSKGVRKDKNTCHICYCYTPMRFAHYRHMKETGLTGRNLLTRLLAEAAVERLKRWDLSTTERVDFFIATCNNIQARIKECYGRDSVIVNPPVDTVAFAVAEEKGKEGFYYLVVSRLVPYKKVDTTIEAFNDLKLPLKIVGTGSEYNRLRKMAGSNIEFLEFVSRDTLLENYQNCQALICPQEEDWGIAALEAQACGRPVIAYAKGGALEYVEEGRTGHFFHEQTPEAVIKAVKEFETMRFDPSAIRQSVLKYDKEIFKKKIKNFVEEKYEEFRRNKEK